MGKGREGGSGATGMGGKAKRIQRAVKSKGIVQRDGGWDRGRKRRGNIQNKKARGMEGVRNVRERGTVFCEEKGEKRLTDMVEGCTKPYLGSSSPHLVINSAFVPAVEKKKTKREREEKKEKIGSQYSSQKTHIHR